MRALVTGVGGFVGAHLAARLVADGWEVKGSLRPGGSPARLTALGVGDAVEVTPAELSDPVATRALAEAAGPDVAFHLAAARDDTTPAARAATAAVNGASALWLIDALPASCEAVVAVGSSTEYGPLDVALDERSPLRPRGFFGATKAAGSLLAAAAAAWRGIRIAILRPFQVYGPLDHDRRLVPSALRAARSGGVLPLTTAGFRRDWVFVDDVVEACVRAATADHLPSGQVLNVGTGHQVSNEDLVFEVGRVTGRAMTVAVGAHPGCAWDTAAWVCDPSLARELLGWEAKVGLADGLARCWHAMEP